VRRYFGTRIARGRALSANGRCLLEKMSITFFQAKVCFFNFHFVLRTTLGASFFIAKFSVIRTIFAWGMTFLTFFICLTIWSKTFITPIQALSSHQIGPRPARVTEITGLTSTKAKFFGIAVTTWRITCTLLEQIFFTIDEVHLLRVFVCGDRYRRSQVNSYKS